MSPPNYAVEAEIREACDKAGVLESAQADFVEEFRAGYFDRKNIKSWIESKRADKPQRWKIAGTENNELFVQAFGPEPNMTKQTEVVKLLGETRAAEIAAEFGTKLGSAKPGTVPDHIKPKNGGDHGGNPFAKLRGPNGTINEAAAKEVDGLIKRLGTKKAEAIARAAGKTISGLPLRT